MAAKQIYRKLIILNENGDALRNLPNGVFNSKQGAKGKGCYFWTFASRGVNLEQKIYTPTIEKALKHLAEKGYTNLTLAYLDDDMEAALEERQAQIAVKKGKKAPRSNDEALEIAKKYLQDELGEDSLHPEVHERCLCCSKNCKLNKWRTVLYSCTAFEPRQEIVDAGEVEEEKKAAA